MRFFILNFLILIGSLSVINAFARQELVSGNNLKSHIKTASDLIAKLNLNMLCYSYRPDGTLEREKKPLSAVIDEIQDKLKKAAVFVTNSNGNWSNWEFSLEVSRSESNILDLTWDLPDPSVISILQYRSFKLSDKLENGMHTWELTGNLSCENTQIPTN